MNIIKSSLLIFTLGFLFKLNAQEYNKVNGAWNATFIDMPISKKVDFRTELHFRTISFLSVWDQQLFRPQLLYKPSKNVIWNAGYTYIKNYNEDIFADPRIRTEHNIWEQVQFVLPLKKSSFSTWIRLEHRFQEELPLQNDKSTKSFDFSSRIRFRLTYQKLLSKSEAKVTWNFVFYNEIFTILNPSGIPYKFNQNWTFLGFNLKLNQNFTILSGFQKNTIAKSSSNYLKNRFWNTILFYKL